MDNSTPAPWTVRKIVREGVLIDAFVVAPDVNGFAYQACILEDDEYRDGIVRKLADCELIVAAVALVRGEPSPLGTLVPPGSVQLPKNEAEARAMMRAAAMYLDNMPPTPPVAGGPGGQQP